MFQFAGSLSGSTPIVKPMQIGETMYVGQLAMSGLIGGAGGHVQIADAASEAHENDQPIIGIVTGAWQDGVYSSTYRGNGVTYDTTLANVLANTHHDAAMVQVLEIVPNDTLIKGSIYDTTYGTALTTLTETTGDATGLTVTHAAGAVADAADDLATIYCRSGANQGLYRVVTTGGTDAQVCTVAFPYAIAIGDTFVRASCVLGLGGLDIPATANCIDGDAALASYYDVKYHQINLEESGKEWASFYFLPKACGPVAA
jgi:hypothetical protein